MFTQFRAQYPTGSLISELLLVERGTYLVRALVQVGGVTLASGMAAASSIEQAEDQARQRAIAVLGIQAPPAPSVSPGSAKIATQGTQPQEPLASPPAPILQQSTPSSQIKQTANPSHPPTTPVSTSTPNSFFDHESSPETVDANASVRSNSTLDTTGDILATVVEDTDATSDTSDDRIWSASYDLQSSQTDLGGMSDETLDASFDYSEVNNSITVELERVGWDTDKEQDYLQRFYRQRQRSLLHNSELLEFLHYLQAYSRTTQELKRLGWTEKQGREHLELTYNQRSRVLLSCQEIQEFRDYLESQPKPNQGLF